MRSLVELVWPGNQEGTLLAFEMAADLSAALPYPYRKLFKQGALNTIVRQDKSISYSCRLRPGLAPIDRVQ
jgi:hypothetical protein